MTPANEYDQHESPPGLRTFTGAGLDEVLPQIRAELGEDALIVARRDGVEGGVGGFFGRRTIEVDAAPARPPLPLPGPG
ncbi:MAG: GTP-binding signal recognition particle G-domain protein, partial [Solirubrobacterales bacterium]|nr:GTP-binding signal recognition particle G-domain protein [Solirubrobacterales bacterium]